MGRRNANATPAQSRYPLSTRIKIYSHYRFSFADCLPHFPIMPNKILMLNTTIAVLYTTDNSPCINTKRRMALWLGQSEQDLGQTAHGAVGSDGRVRQSIGTSANKSAANRSGNLYLRCGMTRLRKAKRLKNI